MKWLEVESNFTQSEQVLATNGIGYIVGTLYKDSNGIITCESLYEVLSHVKEFCFIERPKNNMGDYVTCYGGKSNEFTGQIVDVIEMSRMLIVEDEVTGHKYQVLEDFITT